MMRSTELSGRSTLSALERRNSTFSVGVVCSICPGLGSNPITLVKCFPKGIVACPVPAPMSIARFLDPKN